MSAKKITKKLSKSAVGSKKVKVSDKNVAKPKKASPIVKVKKGFAKKKILPAKGKIITKKPVLKKVAPKKPIKLIKKVAIKKQSIKPVKKIVSIKKGTIKKAVSNKPNAALKKNSIKTVAKKDTNKKLIVPKPISKKAVIKKEIPIKKILKISKPIKGIAIKKEIVEVQNNKSTKPIVIEKSQAKKAAEPKKIPVVKETKIIIKEIPKPITKEKIIKNKKSIVPNEKEEIPRPVIKFTEGIKRKIIKDLNTLPQDLMDKFHHFYPEGYEKHVTSFMTIKNQLIRVVPMETEEAHYLIKVPVRIVKDTDDDEEDFEAEENDTIGDDSEIESTTEDGEMNFDIADDAAD